MITLAVQCEGGARATAADTGSEGAESVVFSWPRALFATAGGAGKHCSRRGPTAALAIAPLLEEASCGLR